LTADVLRRRIELMVEYLKMRVTMADWHGVRDAAADIEQLMAQLEVVEKTRARR
jgi:hypothetical protein